MSVSRRRIAAVVLRQSYLIRSSFARFLPLFMWVAIDMLLWGFLSRYLDALTGAGMRFVAELLGAVLLWDFLVRVAQGVTIAFLEDVWSRNFLNFFATPLSVTEYLAGLVLTSVAVQLGGPGRDARAVHRGFRASLPVLRGHGHPLRLHPLPLRHRAGHLRRGPGAAPGSRLRMVRVDHPGSGLALRGGLLPRLQPAGMDAGRGAPGSAVLRLRKPAGRPPGRRNRGPASGAAVSGTAAWALGCALTLAYFALACWFFLRTYRYAIRTGLMARYSAESVA